ncbi:MAG: hypothetical protein CL663_06015 [Bacteroidetes bacterium]|nr:hypothetical protein [Bacteroidota bacterium]
MLIFYVCKSSQFNAFIKLSFFYTFEIEIKMKPKVYIALPVLNEFENLERFVKCLENQSYSDFELVVCVNQPDSWWEDAQKRILCEDNQQSIDFLSKVKSFDIQIIDKSAKGSGWDKKKYGIGWARKRCMDGIASKAMDHDIIVSVDADSIYSPDYLSSIIDQFEKNPKSVGLANPYYHPLSGDEENDRNILHYEIYMRYYSINMLRINNPYRYTALGSAMACPVWAYKRIGGITPHKSGEDFYFLQKLTKFGSLIMWNSEKVFPSSRYSDRVFFGTGPALIKGQSGDWSSYPIYSETLFNEVKQSFDLFGKCFTEDCEFPMKPFLNSQFGSRLWMQPLRKNSKTEVQFVKKCWDKVDGLRILQFLKSEQKKTEHKEELELISHLNKFYPEVVKKFRINELSFTNSDVEELNIVRDALQTIEEIYQKENG